MTSNPVTEDDPMAARRELTFTSFDQVMPEVDRLLEGGYETVGNWSLGRICNHLASSLIFSVEGFPGRAPWLARKLFAPGVLRKLRKTNKLPEGVKVPDWALPKPGLDDRAEAEALRAAIRVYTAHIGPMAPHPFFENLTRADSDWTNLLHCAHHLSFVLPRGTASAGAGRHGSTTTASR
jgi:hypothetical protein